MCACSDCPISLVCLSLGLEHPQRTYERCQACNQDWVAYNLNERWFCFEAPNDLPCPKNVIVCQRCRQNGAEEKFPDPDNLSPFVSKIMKQENRQSPLPLTRKEAFIVLKEKFLRSCAVPADLLKIPIHYHPVTFTPKRQLELFLLSLSERKERDQYSMARKQQRRTQRGL